jgi:hypothetical protein
MTNPTPETEEHAAIVRCFKDSSGNRVVSTDPRDIYATGPKSTIWGHVLDSKAQRQSNTLADKLRKRERYVTVREDAVAEREGAVTQVEALIREFCDKVNVLEARVDAFEEQQRAEAEQEERLNEEPISLPPGSTDSDDGELPTSEHPQLLLDGDNDTHGELALHPASRPEDEEQLEAMEVEDDEGPVPLTYGGKGPSLSYVRGEADGPSADEGPGDLPTELTKKVPPETGTEPALPGPREPTARTPVGTEW